MKVSHYTKVAGMVMCGLLVYSLIGTITYRMAEAKWGNPETARRYCWTLDGQKTCDTDFHDDSALLAGFAWPVGLPIVIGVAAGQKVEGVQDALAKRARR